MDYSKVNEIRRYISDNEYKLLGSDIPYYSEKWYQNITTSPNKLTQNHLDLYVASVQFMLALAKNEWNEPSWFYPPILPHDVDNLFYMMSSNEALILKGIQTMEQIKYATTHQDVRELYLSLAGIDSILIDRFYQKTKERIDEAFENMKGALHQNDLINDYKTYIEELNEWKFALRDTVTKQPLYDSEKNVEKYIEEYQKFHNKAFDNMIQKIDDTLLLEERSAEHVQILHETKNLLLEQKEQYPGWSQIDKAFHRTLEVVQWYKEAPAIQPLKEVIEESIQQYNEWLDLPLYEDEVMEIERAKSDAISLIKNGYISDEEELERAIQRIKADVHFLKESLERYTLTIEVDRHIEVDGLSHESIELNIKKDYFSVDQLANNIKVKIITTSGTVTPEILTIQNGQAQALLYPEYKDEAYEGMITVEVVDAPSKHAYLIGKQFEQEVWYYPARNLRTKEN